MPFKVLSRSRLPVNRPLLTATLACAALWSAFFVAPRALAAGPRPLFEPTDLELEQPGVVDIDLQVGAIRSDGPWRAVIPDLEIDVGLARNVELDLDATYAIEGPPGGQFAFDRAAPDNIWFAAKLGLFDARDLENKSAWALGLQMGPKLPVARDARGAGYEALALVGRTVRRVHLVFNAGGLVDPGGAISAQRPAGLEAGLDLDIDLNEKDTFSFVAELGGVRFVSSDPDQLHATAGILFSPNEYLDFSSIGLVGFLPQGDRFGTLFGVSPKFALWK